jgi:hypothetical protein
MIVEVHGVDVAAELASETDGDHLPAFGVIAEAGGVRHPDELVLDDRVGEFQRRRDHRAQRIGGGPVGDDEEFAID